MSTPGAIRWIQRPKWDVTTYPLDQLKYKIAMKPKAGEDVEKVAGGNVKWCRHSGKLFDGYL